jgi:hypothetical protein
MHRSKHAPLFDYLAGGDLQGLRHCEAERLRDLFPILKP